MAEKKQHIKNVEIIRFLFAIVIVVYHFFYSGPGCLGAIFTHSPEVGKLSNMLFNGMLAVDMFFIMAGFFLVYTYNPSLYIKDFIKKKLIRLYPLVVFFALISTFIYIFIFQIPNYLPHEQVLRLLLMDNLGFNLVHSRLTWYVSVLFWISLFYFYIIKNIPKKYVDLIVPIIVLFCYTFIIHCNNGHIDGNTNSVSYVFNMGVMRGLAGMGTGYLLYQFFISTGEYTKSFKNSLLYTSAEAFLLFFVFNNLAFHHIKYHTNFIIILGFVGLFLLFLLKRGFISQLLDNKLSSKLGRYAYAIYIVHLPVFAFFKTYLWTTHPSFVEQHIYFNIAITTVAAIICGIVLYHFVEQPAAKYLSNKWFPKNIDTVKIKPLSVFTAGDV